MDQHLEYERILESCQLTLDQFSYADYTYGHFINMIIFSGKLFLPRAGKVAFSPLPSPNHVIPLHKRLGALMFIL